MLLGFPRIAVLVAAVCCFHSAAAEVAALELADAHLDLPAMTVIGVTGDTERVAGSAHRIDQATLEAYRYDDINRVLNFVPGVYVREEDGFGLRPNIGLRGASADRSAKVTLMEDGILLGPAPYSAPAAYFFPLSARMTGIEVFKGPASIQHGPQTIGGAINMISAPVPESFESTALAMVGSNGYRRAHLRAGGRGESLGWLGEFVHLGSDGFKDLDGGGDTGFDKNEFVGKGEWDVGSGRLRLRVSYSDEISNETYLGLTQTDARATPYRRYGASALDRMDWSWQGARVGWRSSLWGGDIDLVAYAQSFERAWRKFNNFQGADIREVLANPDTPFNRIFVDVLQGADTDGVAGSTDDLRIGTNDREFRMAGLQAVQNWALGGNSDHLLQVGLRIHSDEVERLHDEFAFEQESGQLVDNGLPRAILTDNQAKSMAYALWIRHEIIQGDWTVVPGVRVESIHSEFENRLSGEFGEHDYTVVLPGLGLSYALNDHWSVLAGVHRGFAPAAPSATVENDPEKSINYELGTRGRSAAGNFEVIGFLNDYSNLTAICTVSSGCDPQDLDSQTSAGEVEAYGVEAGWDHAFELTDNWRLPIRLSYTWTRATFGEDFLSADPQFGQVEEGFELPYVPRHRANINLGLQGRHWSTDLSASYLSRMRDRAGKGDFTVEEGSDNYVVLDLAARYRWGVHWEINARIDNLLDEEYIVSRRPFGARPGRPRFAQLGLTYTY